ncbi:two-component system, chemotaxis family, protein-glutamate methylesterase/glutaminase [Pararobbsia alpina]|uniref:chemotaxis protein CheB n=1 Tax=Pararobbsia alpina TaxID=621374 RepID=UPI0039A67605
MSDSESVSTRTDWPFDAVVIGASAGGVELLGALLPRLPAAFPSAVLIVQHLRASTRALYELYAPRCAIRVCEAADKQPIEAGTVYFAPPDYHLLVEADMTCALSVDDPVQYSRPSIDVLFESAAWAYRSRVLGILLTGASDDGAAGMTAIRNAGGATWAQLPSTARSVTMPLSAISRGVVDEVLTPDDIAHRLAHLCATPDLTDNNIPPHPDARAGTTEQSKGASHRHE